MTGSDRARTPGELFAAWRPRDSFDAPVAPGPGSVRVRPATAADLTAAATVAIGRNGRPLDEELASFERRLAASPRPDVPMVWVAELQTAEAWRIVAYGTLFHLTDEGRRAMADELGLDPERAHEPALPGSLVPAGWYLGGLVVEFEARRLGLGRALTLARLEALDAAGVPEVRYLANAQNRATLALHEPFGFELEAENPAMGGVTFTGGRGVLLVRR